MTDVKNGTTAGGGRFELPPPDPDGHVQLVAKGAGVAPVLEAGLSGLIALIQRDNQATLLEGGQSTSIRAEAATNAELFTRLALDSLDRIESLELVVASVHIDGLARSDAGHLAWGRLVIAANVAARHLPVSIVSQPDFVERHGELTMRVSIKIG